jgi:hypothetical protein
MPILVNCPSCRQTVQVPDNLIDQFVRCPACESTFTATRQMALPDPVTVEYEAGPEIVGQPSPPAQSPAPLRPVRSTTLRPHRGVVILVLGILSIVLICGIGLILGPIAWIMGSNDLREIHEGRMDPAGEGLTMAGRICGIVGTCLHGLGLFCCMPGLFMHQPFWIHRF